MSKNYRLNLMTEQVLEAAKDLAAGFGHSKVDSGHLLLTILKRADSKAYIVMESMGIHLYEVENAYRKINPPLGRFVDKTELSTEIENALDTVEAKTESPQQTITLQELFETFFSNPGCQAVKIIETLGFPIETVISEMRSI